MSLTARTRPAAGDPEGLLVLFHGRGADEHDLYPLLDVLDPGRRLLGVTPRGPLSAEDLAGGTSRFPQTLSPGPPARTGGFSAGAHWYAVQEVGYPDPSTFLPTYAEASEWLDALGFAPEQTVLGGFSQGAVMSYALGLGKGRPKPAAIVALSGFIPTVPGFEVDLEPPLPPVAIGHGTYDPVIEVGWGRKARALLEQAGADVTYHEAPMPHAIDPRFATGLAGWIERALAPEPSAR